jgi:hypothetical protein
MRFAEVALFTACIACLPAARIARADEKGACMAAHEHGQEVRLANHWIEARRLFLDCAQPRCPGLIVRDCTRWEGELAQQIPSVIVLAKRADGSDVGDVALFVDGALFASKLPAVPIALDPGEHVLRFERPGWSPVEMRVILHDREHDRKVEVHLDGPASEGTSSRGGAPVAGYGFAAVAAVATAAAVTFVVMGKIREHDLATSPCGQAGTCADADVAPIRVDYIVSGIAAGVAALTAGIAIWQFVAHGARSKTASAWPLRLEF